MTYKISPQSRTNILKLIAGLEGLPNDYTHFMMGTFARDPHMAAKSTPEHPCGTSACIIGHGPHFGVSMNREERFMISKYHPNLGFYKYSYRLFIPEDQYNCWDFCFSGEWPNIIQEAIARLKMYLYNKTPADGDWDYHDRYANKKRTRT